ncbi:MAG TPA: apolipoprotein N-acyltransferase [Sphingomonas sp.]|uniref:apolipoprotein N-acyltransferase n=1 Tax=Sphingomonas sp. TaxID=28214 RepID=UPI002C2A9468|nr:apolipoprotein N-acyltransferase [Sphingomonas sp.]HMI19280.1 apolipoprotein N-acyltransferase [Sphingomonas sp.]
MPPLRATRAYPIAFVLGLTAACGFAPLEWWPLTLLCLAGLAALLDQAKGVRRAAALGWWFGLGHFCLGLNWIATAFTYQAAMPAWLGWVAVVLVSLYLALFPAFASSVAWLLARRNRSALPLLFAAAWIVSELLRAALFTGFAWNPLAAIWAPVWPMRALTALVGTYGLSGLTILIAGLIWRAVENRNARIGLAVLVAGGAAAAFFPHVAATPGADTPLLHVVQPNIGQDRKWDDAQSADNYHRLTSLSGKPGPHPRILLWPEVAVPALLEQDQLARSTLASLLGPHDLMLTGAEAVRFSPDGDPVSASNSLFGLDPQGNLFGRYDKAHLVPYGEYLPMRPLLSRLGLSRLAPGDIDFDAGPGPRDIMLPGIGKVGIQICYEIIFSGQVVDRANRPAFLFNPSNDAWFGRWGPPQHLAQARLRATEEGLPVVRSTPTGISAVIDADGRLLASLPWRTAGAIELPLPPAHAPTLFARWGNILPLVLALFLGALGFASRRRPS